MRVRLKGLNSRRKTLADGRTVTYYWAWKGGPRIEGEPGSPEFMASYYAAVSAKLQPRKGNLAFIIGQFLDSAEFSRLAPRTQQDYRHHLDAIERKFGTFPLSGLKDRRSRGIFKAWRDDLAKRSLRQADYGWTILARLLSWALDRGIVDANPCERGGRLYRASRAEYVWSYEDEDRFLAVASAPLRLAFLLALYTGQRQGDLLRLTWANYDGTRISLRQGKTGARVRIPVAETLKAALEVARSSRRGLAVLVNQAGEPWTEDGFRSSWRKACAKAGISGLTFHDLRGSAVTRLAIAGATEAEIATFTGHGLADVRNILDHHYLNRDDAMADSAVRKLERRTNIPD